MKIGIFTDSHFSSTLVSSGIRHYNQGLERIGEALRCFEREKCEMIVCLGDLIDAEKNHTEEIESLKKIAALFDGCNIPTYVLMGNHDAFAFDVDEFYTVLGEKYRPQNHNVFSNHFIFLDACFFKNKKHYKPGDTDWTDTFLPNAEELECLLKKADGPIHIFVHQNLDPFIDKNHRIQNADEIRRLCEHCGKVKNIFQGHYHLGNRCEVSHIRYITFDALCENERAYYVVDV